MNTDIIKSLDTEIAMCESQAAKLRKARAILAPPTKQEEAPAKPRRQARAKGKPSTSRAVSSQQVERVRETLAETLHGQASQHRIGQEAGMRSPAVSMAVRQLEADGVVRRTGAKEGRSPVIELVRAPAADVAAGNGEGAA